MKKSNDTPQSATNPHDIELIAEAGRDYIESWFYGDAERMQRCLHPELVKRTLMYDPGQSTWLLRRPGAAQMMVEFTQEGGGSDVPEMERTYESIVQDVFRHIACVKVVSREMMDYLHLAKLDDDWHIANVLWELREGEVGPDS